MRSKIVVMKSTSSGVGLIGLDSLLDVYANTVAGDLVTVYPGTYNIGDNSIQLKDGVNWNFIGRPTIISDSVNGTFKGGEGVEEVEVHWEGKPIIRNTTKVAAAYGGRDFSRYIVSNGHLTILGWEMTYIATVLYGEGMSTVVPIRDDFGLPNLGFHQDPETPFNAIVNRENPVQTFENDGQPKTIFPTHTGVWYSKKIDIDSADSEGGLRIYVSSGSSAVVSWNGGGSSSSLSGDKEILFTLNNVSTMDTKFTLKMRIPFISVSKFTEFGYQGSGVGSWTPATLIS